MLRLDPPGLTIVAFFKDSGWQKFEEGINDLEKGRKSFLSYLPNLHVTILNILSHDQPALDSSTRDIVIEAAIDSMRHVAKQLRAVQAKTLHLEFNIIRPGLLRGGPPSTSDGSVIALGSKATSDEILRISDMMRQRLNSIVNDLCIELRLKRSLPGVWATLGIFDEPGAVFPINGRLERVFNQLSKMTINDVILDEISLVEFRNKSLSDSNVLAKVSLSEEYE